MSLESSTLGSEAELAEEAAMPACVMCFNANDPSGAGGLAADIATVAAIGGHALPIVTSIGMRDTAQIFDHHCLEADTVAEQARSVLEDVQLAGWKVGFLGSAEIVGAVAEILSDYPDIPLVAYMPNLAWMEEDDQQSYLEAFRDLVLPQTEVLMGNHQTLTDFLLPEWDANRPASPRELAAAAAEHGTRFVLVTSVPLPDQFMDNVLASAQGPITGEKFERFEVNFIGAGETLSAALAALLASGAEVQDAVAEALAFLDQSLDAGFRPGMGNVIPDRFFWAQGPSPSELEEPGEAPDELPPPTGGRRQIH
jgi:hydroxymethylpyrimidine/phosphomethylpyrimidine kinase